MLLGDYAWFSTQMTCVIAEFMVNPSSPDETHFSDLYAPEAKVQKEGTILGTTAFPLNHFRIIGHQRSIEKHPGSHLSLGLISSFPE